MYSHLRLVIEPHNPWIVINETIDKQYCEGIQCDLLKYVSKSLNFSYEFITDEIEIENKSSGKLWGPAIALIHENVRLIKNDLDL
jgi:hypothetical protein